jgi:hypothetical protein
VTDPDSADAAEQRADEFGCAITSITVESGQELPLSAGGSVNAIVGANNVGKSTLLREIKDLVSQAPGVRAPTRKVLKGLQFGWLGDVAAMEQWVLLQNKYDSAEVKHQFTEQLPQLLRSRADTGFPGRQWNWFINQQTPSEREMVCDPAPRLDFVGDRAKHPFHILATNQEARSAVQSLAQKLFQQHLEFDNLSGKIGFAVGEPKIAAPAVNAVSTEYAAALGSFPETS